MPDDPTDRPEPLQITQERGAEIQVQLFAIASAAVAIGSPEELAAFIRAHDRIDAAAPVIEALNPGAYTTGASRVRATARFARAVLKLQTEGGALLEEFEKTQERVDRFNRGVAGVQF